MCLAIPGKILKIKGQLAQVDFDGVKKDVNIFLVNGKVGDWVVVHAGFAIEKVEEKEGEEILKIIKN